MNRTVLTAMLLAGWVVTAAGDVESLRLKQAPGELTIPAEAPDTPAGKRAALTEYLTSRHDEFDAGDPMCRSLLWFYSHHARPVDDQKQIRLNEKYHNIGVEYFNHAQKLYSEVAGSAGGQPTSWLAAWRDLYARRVIEERLKLPIDAEKKKLSDIPVTERVATPKTPAKATEAIKQAYGPSSAKERSEILRVLARINPGLSPDGWYLTKQVPKESAVHAVVPAGDGWGEWKRIERYRLTPETPLLLPASRWVKARAAEMKRPAASAPAAKPANEVFCVELKTALRNEIPLRIFLTRRGREFTYAWAFTPTVSNRPHDVFILDDSPDGLKLSLAVPTGDEQVDRLMLTLKLHSQGQGLAGSFMGELDLDERKGVVKGDANAVPLARALPPTDKLAGSWKWYMGPADRARTAEHKVKLVDDLDRARLAWVSDEQIPVGRGPDTRGKVEKVRFETLSGGWASPVTNGNRVILSYYEPSGEHYAWGADKAVAENPEDKHLYRLNLIEADDIIHCFDARTGRTLWKRRYAGEGLSWSGFNKSGPEMTPCIADGKVYAVGTLGNVYCVEAATGRTLWRSDIGRRARLLRFQRGALIARGGHFGSRSDFSTRVVPAGDVIVVCDHVRTKGGDEHYRYELWNGLKAFDRETGRVRWHHPGVGSVASRWVHDGKEYILASGLDRIRCIEPNTGKVLWTVEGDSSAVPLATTEDRLLCVIPAGRKTRRIRCLAISPEGAKVLWTTKPYAKNNTPMAIADGHAYLPGGRDHIVCLSMVDGSEVGRVGQGGSNSANVLGGGRMLLTPDQSHSKPTVLYINADPTDFRLLDVWNARISGSYTTPLMMPLVDGRLIARFRNRLVCYDLRESSAVTDRPHAPKEGDVGLPAPPKPKPEPEPKKTPKPTPEKKGPSLPDLDDDSLDPLKL
ncbi:MAG: PQQ-binding-like beta-propeller repeat protein [Planctomycetota bacterium]